MMSYQEMLMWAVGLLGFITSVLMILVAYTGDRMNKSIDDIRNTMSQIKDSVSDKLGEITKALMAIEKDIRMDLKEHEIVLKEHDRRIDDTETRLDIIVERRHSEGRRSSNGKRHEE